MGLQSALTTALTGLTAAETQIDVVGNNLANSQTVGFKSSDTIFATQFLQTRSLGAAPSGSSGGTNPRQIGLGTQVAEITPDFTQGTIEVSSSPSDLAIQGDGFFIVEGSTGEQLYTRNGQFKTNAENELVTVTGNRLLGFGVDDEFRVQTTTLQPLTIPLGSAAVAQATENVFYAGTVSPTGEIADQARVVESAVLGDAAVPRPDIFDDANGNGVVDAGENPADASVATIPDGSGVTISEVNGGAGAHAAGAAYQYRYTFVDSSGQETLSSDPVTHVVTAANSDIQLDSLPTDSGYDNLRIYRTEDGGGTFYQLDEISMAAAAGPYVDSTLDAGLDTSTEVDNSTINGNYTYLVTYHRAGEEESRPSLQIGPVNVVNSRAHLENLPVPPVPSAGDGFPAYDSVRIYRNLSSDASSFYLVDTVDPGASYTDKKSDAEISDLTIAGNQALDLDGPKIASNTLLTNVVRRDGLDYVNQFTEGTLTFQGEKGEKSLAEREFEVTSFTTVQDLLDFMHDSMGIQTSADDPQNPVPSSVNTIIGETGLLSPGATINGGKIRFVSNNGLGNAISIGNSAFTIDATDGSFVEPQLSFGTVQEANGERISSDVIVYDSLGTPLNLSVTLALESRDDNSVTYRWYADSSDNDPVAGTDISVGTGLISFDSDGNFQTATNTLVGIDRRNVPASSPLEFDLDFSEMSGLATDVSEFNADRQDGFATGKLTSFIVGEDGVIRGVFSNGASRNLGQIRMARFSNPAGLEQKGQNLFSAGVNSGLPVQGNPGNEGIGQIIAGAVELSNTDIGRNLIDLVLATTQYRGNTRVINSAQQLLDELLNLRR